MRIFSIQRLLGILLMIFSFTFFPPALVAWLYDDGQIHVFLEGTFLVLLLGFLMWLPAMRYRDDLRVRVGFLLVVLFWFALGLNWLGWWLASHLEFFLGRRLRGDFDIERKLERLPRWLRRFPVEHPVFLIFARQVPWAGGHLTTLVPGAMGVPFFRSAWCNAIAIIPAAILTAGLGAGLLAL